MGTNSKIEWCDHTFNPWVGCTKISPACDHCYAESWAKRSGMVAWGNGAERRRTSAANWKQPLRWNRHAQRQHDSWEGFRESLPGLTDEEMIARGFIKPRPPRVFCASLADVFDNEVPDSWRMDLFGLMADTPDLDWMVLTKRIANVRAYTQRDGLAFDLIGDGRVWLGITVCNQEEADRDIPKLLRIPAAKRFVSIEPMLGPVDVSRWLDDGSNEMALASTLNWIICGGESGPGARPLHPQWARSLRDRCNATGVPFFFKQWGEWKPTDEWMMRHKLRQCAIDLSGSLVDDDVAPQDVDGHRFARAGKHAAGRLLDGHEWSEVPRSAVGS